MNSGMAVFLWTFRRKWKGLTIFIGAVGVLILVIVSIYPEFSELRGEAIAEALGGDMEISLTENSERDGEYTLSWSKYGGADGYVVVQSNTDIPLVLIKGMGVSGVNIQLLSNFLPSDATVSVHTFDASTTKADFTIPKEKSGSDDVVYFGVLAYKGSITNASIEGATETVNTGDLVAKGAYDKLMDNPLMKSWLGDTGIDIYSIKGFLSMELFGSLTMFILIYFLIQYAGAFSVEMEKRTMDIILSTPLSRRRLYVSRYVSWVAAGLIMVVSWTLFMYTSVFAIGEVANAPLVDIARTMLLFLPFLLSVQGFCMLVSVATNDSRKAYGICFAIYYGMYVLRIVSLLSQKMSFLRYFTLFEYWDYNAIFAAGIVPWGGIILLTLLSIGLFLAGLTVFERKDLAL